MIRASESNRSIFTAFSNGSTESITTVHANGGGTGLGLAIVKHIVEAHESRIAIESVIDKGTTFRFSLKAMFNA